MNANRPVPTAGLSGHRFARCIVEMCCRIVSAFLSYEARINPAHRSALFAFICVHLRSFALSLACFFKPHGRRAARCCPPLRHASPSAPCFIETGNCDIRRIADREYLAGALVLQQIAHLQVHRRGDKGRGQAEHVFAGVNLAARLGGDGEALRSPGRCGRWVRPAVLVRWRLATATIPQS